MRGCIEGRDVGKMFGRMYWLDELRRCVGERIDRVHG